MRICFVGPANSAHIVKWCNWFSSHGHEIHVVSFTQGDIDGVAVHLIELGVDTEGSDLGKLKYMFTGKKIKAIVDEIKPDVINVHYATSYGIAVALSGIRKYILSVWGSDIYAFPKKSFLHKKLLKYSLRKASCLFSTSQAMADEAGQYTDKPFKITPFGVDMTMFSPQKRTRTADDSNFVIGTVKTLADLYGIDYILKAAAIVKQQVPDINLKIRISGDGPKEEELKTLSENLGLASDTVFTGRISQEEAAVEWANMDIAIIPSVLYESFGVAAIEAEASAVPVIISDVGGLMETTLPGESSIVTPKKDADAIADAILKLYHDPRLRKKMAEAGHKYVTEKYELNQCFSGIEQLLSNV